MTSEKTTIEDMFAQMEEKFGGVIAQINSPSQQSSLGAVTGGFAGEFRTENGVWQVRPMKIKEAKMIDRLSKIEGEGFELVDALLAIAQSLLRKPNRDGDFVPPAFEEAEEALSAVDCWNVIAISQGRDPAQANPPIEAEAPPNGDESSSPSQTVLDGRPTKSEN
jgi:hypothetical protein